MLGSRREFLHWLLYHNALLKVQLNLHMRQTCFFEADDLANGTIKGFRPLDFKSGLTEGGLENGLVYVLKELSSLFDVKVAFGFYDDSIEYPNAGAAPYSNVTLPDGSRSTDGIVAVGHNLVKEIETQTSNVGAAITAVCAHEHGHILQAKYILDNDELSERINDLNERRSVGLELHADFICGYFAAFRKKEDTTYPAVSQAQVQYFRGDKGATYSHGTPQQRGNAVYAGFLLGRQSATLIARDVTIAGLDYVTTNRAWE